MGVFFEWKDHILLVSVRKDGFMEILRVENLTKIYGKGDTAVTALDHVSFTVEKGEFIAVIRVFWFR